MLKKIKGLKRAAALCMVICLILSLSACGGSQKAKEDSASATQDTQETAQDQQAQEEVSEVSEVPAAAETAIASADAAEAATIAAETAAADAAAAETAAAEIAASDATAAETAASDLLPDYSKEENWAYFALGEGKDVDLFLICPTVDTKDEYNMSMDDEEVKKSFFGALNMERGIYEDHTRMFAPYYRQAAMKIYDLSREEREQYLELAYKDVSAAFSWYLENENDGRPIVIAGFSQGADMCYRVMKEFFADSALQDQLVATYAIGWPMTEETDKSLNAGACFTDYKGGIKRELPELCGCYIDPERGVLKVTDVTPQEYPPILAILPEGSYHLYDYQFFFRNLQQNVELRIKAYMESLLENAA